MLDSSEAQTLAYYNQHALSFAEQTQQVDFQALQQQFLGYLTAGDLILDLGCGSGRDTLYFLNQGFDVVAVDGSEKLCTLASAYTRHEVIKADFEDFTTELRFAGIWACASLVHVKRIKLGRVLRKYLDLLRDDGIFYLSFKYGDQEIIRDGRYFNYLNEELLHRLLQDLPGTGLLKLEITHDVRHDHQQERWLNCFIRKKS